MRIAAIADVHGNLPALEAVLEDISSKQVDVTVFVGDVVMGAPDCRECWKLASLNGPLVQGNTEHRVGKFGTPDEDPSWSTEQYGPLRWSAQQFSPEERKQIAELPLTLHVPETEDLVFFHSTPRGFRQIKAYTPEEELQDLFSDVFERYLVRGHHHNPQVRLWNNRIIVNCGSAGAQTDMNPDAQYLILERRNPRWHIQHQTVPYNVEAAVRRFHESGYLDEAGPMGRLFMRQVATATTQVSPFLRYYRRWSKESEITLTDAVERFLNFC